MNWFMVEDQFPVFLTEILTVGFATSVFSISTSGGTGISTYTLYLLTSAQEGCLAKKDERGRDHLHTIFIVEDCNCSILLLTFVVDLLMCLVYK